MPNPRAILFDLGGTLFDFAPMSTLAVFGMAGRMTYDHLAAAGHTLPPYNRYFRAKVWAVRRAYLWSLITRREFNCFDVLCRVSRQMNLTLDDATLRELAWQWYSPITGYTTVADCVIPTLQRLRDRGHQLALISNTCIPGFVLDRHLDLHGLTEFFPLRIYSSEVRYRKPHPQIFRLALRQLNLLPTEAIYVGDRVGPDVKGAQAAGLRAVLRLLQPHVRNAHRADFTIRHLPEIHDVLQALSHEPSPEHLPLACDLT